jgi:TIR domain
MASYLNPRTEALGIGPEARYAEGDLFDSEGRLKSFEVLSEELGDMQAFLGLMELEIGSIMRRPHARGYPPRIFVSYRRESPEDIAWCDQLAQKLEANGYDVLLDERELGRSVLDGLPFAELARFMALLADSDVALVIASTGFVGESKSMRNWIFEEWSRIGYLDDMGLLEKVVVHRSGDIDDDGLFGRVGSRSAYIDLRADPEDHTPVLEFFGRYGGPRLDEAARARLGESAARAVELSLRRPPEVDGARRAFEAISDLADTEEHGVAEAHVRAAEGDRPGCRTAAIETLRRNPTLPSGFLLARLLWLQDFDREAFAACAQLSEGPSFWRHFMRAIMGDVLVREGLFRAAMNQFTWCLVANGSPQLGGYWSQCDPPALDDWRERLAELAGVVEPTPTAACPHCQAEFPQGWYACVYCGTTYPAGEPCRMCDGDPPHVPPITELSFCPVCRRGTTDDGESYNANIVPREPKGAWSPLAWQEGSSS